MIVINNLQKLSKNLIFKQLYSCIDSNAIIFVCEIKKQWIGYYQQSKFR
jgi:hypothetical protein